ncbi:hypothetical protein QQ045_012406 [Rhodiola kirilowii]
MFKAEVRELLHFPLNGFCDEYGKEEQYEFYKFISCFNYYFATGWSSIVIKESLWKIVHYMIGMSINPRAEGATVVANTDMDFMISMHKGLPVDFFQILTNQMVFWGSSMHNLALGGGLFITLIAKAKGWDLSKLKNPITSLLNTNKMMDFKMIDRDRNWQHKDEPPCRAKRHRINSRKKKLDRDHSMKPAPKPHAEHEGQ